MSWTATVTAPLESHSAVIRAVWDTPPPPAALPPGFSHALHPAAGCTVYTLPHSGKPGSDIWHEAPISWRAPPRAMPSSPELRPWIPNCGSRDWFLFKKPRKVLRVQHLINPQLLNNVFQSRSWSQKRRRFHNSLSLLEGRTQDACHGHRVRNEIKATPHCAPCVSSETKAVP